MLSASERRTLFNRVVDEMSPIFQGEIIISDELNSYELHRKDPALTADLDRSSHTHIFRDN